MLTLFFRFVLCVTLLDSTFSLIKYNRNCRNSFNHLISSKRNNYGISTSIDVAKETKKSNGFLGGFLSIFKRKSDSKSAENLIPVEVPERISAEVVIVGAGMAGLACAKELVAAGIQNVLLVESSPKAGGRVGTDVVDGYQLDKGFQVFIDSYPESKKLLDFDRLKLKPFLPGALVRYQKEFYLVSDPIRRPGDLIPTLISPIGSLLDKIKVGVLSIAIRFTALSDVLKIPETNTAEYLSNTLGLSDSIVDRFFTPFYQGIFLSPLSEQSSRMLGFLFKMFTDGAATLPAEGMQAIPDQLAADLPVGVSLFNTRVEALTVNNDGTVSIRATKHAPFSPSAINTTTTTAERKTLFLDCKNVVIATCPPTAQRLLDSLQINGSNPSPRDVKISIPTARSSVCLYFALKGLPPVTDPILVLNGENKLSSVGDGSTVINNICFPSQVSSLYAPDGMSLASVTIIGNEKLMAKESRDGKDVYVLSDDELELSVRSQLAEWWSKEVTDSWTLLRVYRIPYAQPAQTPLPYRAISAMTSEDLQSEDVIPVQLANNIYCCGDHRNTATLNGAIRSGVQVGRAIIKERQLELKK